MTPPDRGLDILWYYDVTDAHKRWVWSGYAASATEARSKARQALRDKGRDNGQGVYARKVRP